jgi:hypothetical protein
MSEDDKLNLAAVLCVIGFGCYFVEAFESPATSPKRPPSVGPGRGCSIRSFSTAASGAQHYTRKGGGVQ